jgi:hypothetical protein
MYTWMKSSSAGLEGLAFFCTDVLCAISFKWLMLPASFGEPQRECMVRPRHSYVKWKSPLIYVPGDSIAHEIWLLFSSYGEWSLLAPLMLRHVSWSPNIACGYKVRSDVLELLAWHVHLLDLFYHRGRIRLVNIPYELFQDLNIAIFSALINAWDLQWSKLCIFYCLKGNWLWASDP